MGMPYATRSIGLRGALWTMAPLTLIGATFLSHKVLVNVGHNILVTNRAGSAPAIAIIAAAFLLTTFFTQRRIPTSTIQILVFCIIGTGAALGLAVRWDTILHLAVLWILAPFIAFTLGYLFTKLFDMLPGFASSGAAGQIGRALVIVGGAASLTMGANDVSNATAVFLTTGFSGPLLAGVIGGAGLAVGVVTWGRPLLERVAFDVVKLDMPMATAAQLVQALVVLTAVFFGYFTSMNQALIGAMAGTGFARGRETIDKKVIFGILRGWIIGPAAGAALGYAFGLLAKLA
jgi:inorganic phosphate transporter, PiT family